MSAKESTSVHSFRSVENNSVSYGSSYDSAPDTKTNVTGQSKSTHKDGMKGYQAAAAASDKHIKSGHSGGHKSGHSGGHKSEFTTMNNQLFCKVKLHQYLFQ